jgi:hypothetical protein
MYRGLIFGGLAFAAVFVAERQFESVGSDVKRYNSMRAMSGDPALSQQAIDMIWTYLRSQMKTQRPAIMEFTSAIQSDLVRYLRISTM